MFEIPEMSKVQRSLSFKGETEKKDELGVDQKDGERTKDKSEEAVDDALSVPSLNLSEDNVDVPIEKAVFEESFEDINFWVEEVPVIVKEEVELTAKDDFDAAALERFKDFGGKVIGPFTVNNVYSNQMCEFFRYIFSRANDPSEVLAYFGKVEVDRRGFQCIRPESNISNSLLGRSMAVERMAREQQCSTLYYDEDLNLCHNVICIFLILLCFCIFL
ncbi:uncharacterized protein LOC133035655 [Cannabis sativa]|uniref:uncharacterized protein LOC133035655 n=1 Tax=Cannabis sativa TaxID=3483 RepID=UPI0029CA9A57|nr:uncharacterized protein LOC133035655 [Cannabis sativa]